jgi:hypothetical protein
MFEEEFGLYNENSLDLLLRFPNVDQEGEQYPQEALFSPSKELPKTEDLLPCLDLLGLDSLKSEAPCEIQKMQEACQEQEVKMFKLIEAKQERPKLILSLKRKISECTEAPSSPLRKTKLVRKDKP